MTARRPWSGSVRRQASDRLLRCSRFRRARATAPPPSAGCCALGVVPVQLGVTRSRRTGPALRTCRLLLTDVVAEQPDLQGERALLTQGVEKPTVCRRDRTDRTRPGVWAGIGTLGGPIPVQKPGRRPTGPDEHDELPPAQPSPAPFTTVCGEAGGRAPDPARLGRREAPTNRTGAPASPASACRCGCSSTRSASRTIGAAVARALPDREQRCGGRAPGPRSTRTTGGADEPDRLSPWRRPSRR